MTEVDVSSKIKSLLAARGKKQTDLVSVLGVSSRQVISNKFCRNSWTAAELIKICDYLGCEIFIDNNGDRISLNLRKDQEK